MSTISDGQISLWDSLHDGQLESLISDTLARTTTLLVDVPYLRSFHSLPDTSRFRLVLENVSEVGALTFVPWPGDLVIPAGLSWKDSEALRAAQFKKGRRESLAWSDVAGKLLQTDAYEISHAFLTLSEGGATILTIDLLNDDRSDFPEVRITAERVRFFLGSEHELSRQAFLEFGASYWRAFAARGLGRDQQL